MECIKYLLFLMICVVDAGVLAQKRLILDFCRFTDENYVFDFKACFDLVR